MASTVLNAGMHKTRSALVVDDDAGFREIAETILHSVGLEKVAGACSAEEALEVLKTETFSIIVSDYRMQGMTGVEFLEKLRGRGDDTPMLLVSGAPDKAGVIRAGRHSKVDFRPKPFHLRDFIGAVSRLAA